MQSKTKKKLAAGLAAAAVTVGGAGVAFAYFTGGSDTDTGSATVGSETTWLVGNTLDASNGPLYPGGASSETVNYTVTNTGNGVQHLSSAGVSIDSDTDADSDTFGDAIDATTGDPVADCDASWFAVDNTGAPTAGEVQPGDAHKVTGNAVITMTDVNATQDACKDIKPAYTVSASGA